MLIQLGNLFINTDNIVTIAVYESQGKDIRYNVGLNINGQEYCLYSANQPGYLTKDVLEQLRKPVLDILEKITSYIDSGSEHLKIELPKIEIKHKVDLEELKEKKDV